MPKMKSHSGAKKRFTVTKSGLLKRTHANKNHILNKKSTKRKRSLRKSAYVSPENAQAVSKMLNY